MLRRTPLRLSAAALSVVVCGLASSPAMAAGTAEGSAAAIVGSLAGMDVDSGRYTATNDGSGETTSGTQNPDMLETGELPANEGVLVQDAATTSEDGDLGSVACAGLAGPEASIVELGETGDDCVAGAQTLHLDAGSFTLDTVKVTGTQISSQLPATLPDLPTDQLDALTAAVNAALKTLAGESSLSLDLSAVQAFCTASSDGVSGDADLADAKLVATLPDGSEVTLLALPVDPDPNTDVSATPQLVAKALVDSLMMTGGGASTGSPSPSSSASATASPTATESSTPSASGSAGPSASLTDLPTSLPTTLPTALPTTIDPDDFNDALMAGAAQISAALSPLLSGTLNKQEVDGNSIHVTAFDGELLQAAASATGSALAALQIGDVTCSTDAAEVDAPSASPSGSAGPVTVADVPTAVDSGQAGDQSPVLPIVGGLLLLAGAGVGVRRFWLTRG